MAFDFPNSPTDGQQFTPSGGPTYIYSNGVWKIVGSIGAPGNLSVSDTPPASPANGQMWYESDSGNLFGYIADANSSQWVQINTPAGVADYVKKAGDTMSGDLIIAEATPTLTLQKTAAGQQNLLVGKTGANLRWALSLGDSTAEGGSNAGSDLGISRYDDAGAFINTPLTINRSNGGINANTAGFNLVHATDPIVNFYRGSTRVGYMTGTSANSVLTIGGDSTNINVVPASTLYIGPRTANVVGAARQQISYAGSTTMWGLNMVTENVGTTSYPVVFTYPPSSQVGSITHNTTATAFNTSSDERLKTFTGALSGEDALAIIRADPARRFTWNIDDSEAVGWGAQTSYEVSHDLATPGDDLGLHAKVGDEGFLSWGMDQGKRTPYLWAALEWAFQRIEALEARLAELEAPGGV